MKLTDQALRQMIVERSNAASEPTLDLDLLVSAARNELDADQRHLLIETIADDPAAAAEYQLAKSIGVMLTEHQNDLATGKASASTGFRIRPQWAIAASLFIAVGLFGWLGLQTTPEPDITRGLATPTSPTDGEVLSQPPRNLRWPAQPGTDYFRVEIVLANKGQLLWRSEPVALNTVELPTDVVEKIEPDQLYQWRILTTQENQQVDSKWRTFSVK